MRWMNVRLREERGASAVIVGLLMIPLIGCLAITLDVGALYAERAQLQNGADAAALAIAENCVTNRSCVGAGAIAQTFADANANDGAATVGSITYPTTRSVRVLTSTREDGTNATAIRHPFASMIGTEFSTVGAEATAEWGSPQTSAVVLPLAISLCDFRPALDGTKQLIRYDVARRGECAGPEGSPIPGGFAWIDRVEDECAGVIDLDDESLPSDPGNDYPTVCDDTMANLEGRTILVPIYDGATVTHGSDKAYRYFGFAAFTVTGWKFSGSGPGVNVDPDPTVRCTGSCRGIQGFFTRWVSPDAAGAELGGPDLGATIIRLSN